MYNPMQIAIKAERIITLQHEKPARGIVALNAPLKELRNSVIVAQHGVIEAIESESTFVRRRAKIPLHDLGAVTLAPALVNCHCHLELSHLAGQTSLGKGFVSWLKSLIPLIAKPVDPQSIKKSMETAVYGMLMDGIAHVGDVGSRNPAGVALAAQEMGRAASRQQSADSNSFGVNDSPDSPSILMSNERSLESALSALQHMPESLALGVTHFLEAFGFEEPYRHEEGFFSEGHFPAAAATLAKDRHEYCAVAGHALYTTSPDTLQAAHAWCVQQRRPFSMHLAEHSDEVECLLHGRGELYDLLAARILPLGWRAPALRPVPFAYSLGLLGPQTLAVHSVHCNEGDIALLAQTNSAVCLCPRSNVHIGTGLAPAKPLADAGVLLCLGTDSLASNTSLALSAEMEALGTAWNFSIPALLRMATINGAAALGLSTLGTLEPGKQCRFSLW